MATFTIFFNFLPTFVSLCFLNLLSNPIFASSFQTFNISPNFDPQIALFGDAKVVKGGAAIKLTSSFLLSSGFIMQTKSITFLQSNPRKKLVSFSTDFSFSTSLQSGVGIAFLIVAKGYTEKFNRQRSSFVVSTNNRVFSVELYLHKDDNVSDMNAIHVGIDLSSRVSVKDSNISWANVVVNNATTLRSWIDYDASSRRLEVRLSEFGSVKPYDPLYTYLIDLSEMWKNEEVFAGLSSLNGNSLQPCSVYSWKFKSILFPNWMHSEPLNPEAFAKEHSEIHGNRKRGSCILTVASVLIFATGCGALIGYTLLFLWTTLISRHKMVAEEVVKKLQVDFRYEKINVVTDDGVYVKK